MFRTGLKIEIATAITTFRYTDFESLLKKDNEIENLLKRKEELVTIIEVTINSMGQSRQFPRSLAINVKRIFSEFFL